MATTIKLKNSVTTTNTPTSLAQGEVAINITDKKVWVGNAATTPIQLLGDGGSVNFTTVDTTNLQVTNIKAKDGTASASIANSTGAFTVAAAFAANGGATLGDASGDALTINSSAVSIPNGLNFDSNTFVIDAANNRVGIGTASPSTILELSANNTGAENNTLRLTDTATNTTANQQIGKIEFYSSDTSSPGAGVKSYIGAFATDGTPEAYLAFATADGAAQATERMRITSTGNVGIGTSSPGQLLTLNATLGSGFASLTSATTPSAADQRLFGIGAGSVTDTLKARINFFSSASWTDGVSTPTYISFATTPTSSTTPTERMRIDSSGNVGIGTSSPVGRFQVSGADAATLTLISGATKGVRFNISSAVSNIEGVDNTGTGSFQPLSVGGSLLYLNSGGSIRATLDASGNLGLGVTPSAWASGRVLELGALGNALWGGSGYTSLTQNAYLASGSVYTYARTASAARFDVENNTFKWHVAGSGTAGNAITFTQAMTLDASGNLLVGTTTASTKVTVNLTSANDGITLRTTNEGAIGLLGMVSPGSNNDIQVGTLGNNNFRFFTNGTANERMRITSGGDVCIGQTTSSGKLTVNTTSNTSGLYVTTSGVGRIGSFFSTAGADSTVFGIYIAKFANDTTTAQRFIGFSVNNDTAGSGQINANGVGAAAFGTFSDARLKENIVNLPEQLSNICALRPVEFDYKDGSGHQIGFIAQEMQAVYPDVVAPSDNEMLMITGWSKTEARLVKAIQEQQAMIEELKQEVALLKSK